MLYELRTYYPMPGRQTDLLNRIEKLALSYWDKHGIKQVGFWTPVIGPHNHKFYYMLQWENLAEREHKWTAMQTDPEWLAKRAETERNGPLLDHFGNEILTPTSFSNLK